MMVISFQLKKTYTMSNHKKCSLAIINYLKRLKQTHLLAAYLGKARIIKCE